MVDVLFTHSYFLRFDPKELAAIMPYPPLGTLFAENIARDHGYSVVLSDSMPAEREEEFRSALEHHRPGVVVIHDDHFNYLTKICLSWMGQAAFAPSASRRRWVERRWN
jgi:anaerobic magnesium-protoporphyrin IX monomethyl ester cyclase